MSGSPSPTRMSKMFEPKTFEVASVTSPFFALATEMTVSGTEVAAAVIVKAIIIGATPSASDKSIEEPVRKNVAMPIATIVMSAIPISLLMLMFFVSAFCLFFSLCFFVSLAIIFM